MAVGGLTGGGLMGMARWWGGGVEGAEEVRGTAEVRCGEWPGSGGEAAGAVVGDSPGGESVAGGELGGEEEAMWAGCWCGVW
jgi:hypothetical protein